MADETISRADSLKKLNEMVKDINFAMLTTAEADGTLRSRPMATQKAEFDGTLYFFTKEHSPKVEQIQQDRHVNVAYSEPSKHNYVSMSGKATLITEKTKLAELWTPELTAWFPKGLEDPELSLLEVNVTQAEYWDSTNSTIVYLYGLAKAAITGQPAGNVVGENEKINL